MKISISSEERYSFSLDPNTIDIAADQIKKNGYIVIEQVLDEAQIESLKQAFEPLFDEYIKQKGFNTGTNRAQMYLPFREPFCHEYVIANPIALSIIERVIGSECRCSYLATDTACPGSDYQQVHSDTPPLFPELGVSLPSYCLVLNIPLVDVTENNGPLEVWPGGTHLDHEKTTYTELFGPTTNAARYMYSEKLTMKAGSMIIRDIRMWHRGTPNFTETNRTNLALTYTREWFGAGGNLHIPQETYDQLSNRAKQLFRAEKIGAPIRMPWDHPDYYGRKSALKNQKRLLRERLSSSVQS